MNYIEMFIYISLLGLFSYFVGYYFKNNKLGKLRNVFFDHAAFITILVFIFGLISSIDVNLKQAAFTFSSVSFGFWLGNEQKRRDELKTLKYYLGLLWEEQRYNLHQFSVIKQNFRFLFDSPERIPLNAVKMNNIYPLTGLLKSEAHAAYISSGAVTFLTSVKLPVKEKDALFNQIEIAYNNMKHFRSFLMTVNTDFNNKAQIAQMILASPFVQQTYEDMEEKVKASAQELMIARRSAIKAKNDLGNFLDKLEVKVDEEELRQDTLTQEDENWVESVIRREPVNPQEIFQKVEPETE